jgi:multiple sugar transport system permease protein
MQTQTTLSAKPPTAKTPAALRVRRGGPRRQALVAYAFILPYLLAFLLFQLVPFLTGIVLSFSRWELLEGTQEFVGLENFVEIVADDLFWQSFFVSVYFAVLTMAGNAVVALAAALALKTILHGQTFFRIVLYLPVILSISVVGIVWGRVISNDGLLNFYITQLGLPAISFLGDARLVIPSLSLVTVWWGFGFPMLIFLAALYAVPESLYEAAKLDGAGSLQLFRFITLPLLRYALLLVLVTQFISHMQVFGQPYILTKGGPGYASYPLIMYIYQTAWRYYHMGYAAAMAAVMGVFMLFVVLLQTRMILAAAGGRDDGCTPKISPVCAW